MPNAINFYSIKHVQIGTTRTAVVLGTDVSGAESQISLKLNDVPKVAGPLLCCAAVAEGPTPGPLPTSIIPGCHLPVKNWAVGRSTFNGEPLLTIEIFGGSTLVFQLAPQTAVQCGQAL